MNIMMRRHSSDSGPTRPTGISDVAWEPVPSKSRASCMACLREAPWLAFAAAACYVIGLVIWILGAAQMSESTMQAAELIRIDKPHAAWLQQSVTTVITVISIAGFITAALVVALSAFRALQRCMLRGGVSCCKNEPEPILFSAYQRLNVLLNALVWGLVLATGGIVMLMLLCLGVSLTVAKAIRHGTEAADAALAPVGLSFAALSDASQELPSVLRNLTDNQQLIESLLGDELTPFQPFCPSVCLNIGSLAQVIYSKSCVCGKEDIEELRLLALDTRSASTVALAGAIIMYVGSTALLMILAAHYVHASYDRLSALELQQQREMEYENGYIADPKDCVPAPPEGTGAMTRSGSKAAPLPPLLSGYFLSTRPISLQGDTGRF